MVGQLAEREADAAPPRVSKVGGIAADQLRSIVERIERLNEEASGLAADIKDVFAEAKGNGYDVKTLKKVIKLRAMDVAERDEAEHLLDTYCRALGLKAQIDLFQEGSNSTESPSDDDALYREAVNLVLCDDNPSASYVQRMLRIGYSRAAALLERMEREEIVSAANHVGKREVLVNTMAG